MMQIFKADARTFIYPYLVNCIAKRATLVKDSDDYYVDLEVPLEHKTPHGKAIDYLPLIVQDNIVRCRVPWGTGFQAFRLNNITYTPRYARCQALHVGYDSRRYVIVNLATEDLDLEQTISAVLTAANASADFTYQVTATDKANTNSMTFSAITLLDAFRQIADKWNVQMKFDNWKIIYQDYPTIPLSELIQDGYNLRDIEMSENWDNVGNSILFTGYKGVSYGAMVDIKTQIQDPNLIRDIRYDKVVRVNPPPGWDVSQEPYIIAYLMQESLIYGYKNKMLQVNYKITADVKAKADIGDIIPVKHQRLGVDINTSVISLNYDTLTDRYTKVEFGNYTPNIKRFATNFENTVGNLNERLEKGGL